MTVVGEVAHHHKCLAFLVELSTNIYAVNAVHIQTDDAPHVWLYAVSPTILYKMSDFSRRRTFRERQMQFLIL